MNVDLILTRDAAKVLFKANMTKKIRKKTKENIIERKYRISFERVLIENEIIRLREDEIRKNENVMQKKMIAKMKKSIAAKKKRIHAKEVIMRKRKREKEKAVKELKKTSKSKRIYRRRFQNSFVSVFSKKIASETEQSTLQIKKSEVDSSASFMRNYTYQ
jgi:hypothetical protein